MENTLKKLKDQIDLSFEETKVIFTKIMSGEASEDEMYEFLTLLSNKGEVSSEIAAGVYVLRDKSTRVNVDGAIDTCGTGGDGKNTLNISTASALLLASMGIKVAKHGNKAVSSKCGSGDVLEKLNININLDAKSVEDHINKLNFGFIKTLTGGDNISGRTLFCEPEEYKPNFNLFLQANTIPDLPPSQGENAVERRMVITRFENCFVSKEKLKKSRQINLLTTQKL